MSSFLFNLRLSTSQAVLWRKILVSMPSPLPPPPSCTHARLHIHQTTRTHTHQSSQKILFRHLYGLCWWDIDTAQIQKKKYIQTPEHTQRHTNAKTQTQTYKHQSPTRSEKKTLIQTPVRKTETQHPQTHTQTPKDTHKHQSPQKVWKRLSFKHLVVRQRHNTHRHTHKHTNTKTHTQTPVTI